MQVKAVGYQHATTVSLLLVPETEVERVLLHTLWTQGRLELCNGVADATGQGFCITTQENITNTENTEP